MRNNFPETSSALSEAIEEIGPLLADGALDLVRIPKFSAEAYYVELETGRKLCFGLISSGLIDVKVSIAESLRKSAGLRPTAIRNVDLLSFTFRAPRTGCYVVTLRNARKQSVAAAVFLRTSDCP